MSSCFLIAAHASGINWTEATAVGTLALAAATFYLAIQTRATARSANDELAESVALSISAEKQAKAVAAQTAAVVEQAKESGKQTAAAIEQAAAVKAQSDATSAQIELLRDQTEAARRQSDAAEAALNASVRPLMSAVPRGTLQRVPGTRTREAFRQRTSSPASVQASDVDMSQIFSGLISNRIALVMPVINIGAGVARLRLAALSFERVMTPAIYVYAYPPSVAAPDQIVRVEFSSDHEPSPGWTETLVRSTESLLFELSYTDIAGRQLTTTQIALKKDDEGTFHTRRVDLDAKPRFTDREDPPSLTG